MILKLIPVEYPSMVQRDLRKCATFLNDKCSEYYFLDFLRVSRGNVEHAISFYKFDEQMRTLLMRYLIRFEIQIKNDFIVAVEHATSDQSFWNQQKYYFPSALRKPTITKPNGRTYLGHSAYDSIYKKVNDSLTNLQFNTPGPSNYAAFYAISFGTFMKIYKYLRIDLKMRFINKYTKYLPLHSFEILNKYLLCLKIIRNRCAHGNHVISMKLVNQLNQFSALQRPQFDALKRNCTVFELSLYFLMKNSKCSLEFSGDLKVLLEKYKSLYTSYGGTQSITPTILSKLF